MSANNNKQTTNPNKLDEKNTNSNNQENNPRLSMEGLLKHARMILEQQLKETDPQNQIPTQLLKNCHGIALITSGKVGFAFVGAQAGTGIILSKVPQKNSWSAPIAIGFGGASLGIEIGASKTDIMLIFTSHETVQTFIGKNQLRLGADAQVAAGRKSIDVGSGFGCAQNETLAPILAYSQAKGFYAGITLEGNVLAVRKQCNIDFYGTDFEASKIAEGYTVMPVENSNYNKMIELLNKYNNIKSLNKDKNEIPASFHEREQAQMHMSIPSSIRNNVNSLSLHSQNSWQSQQSSQSSLSPNTKQKINAKITEKPPLHKQKEISFVGSSVGSSVENVSKGV